MFNRRSVLAACSVASLALTWVATGRAWMNPHRPHQLTFSRAVSLPGVTLGAGTYVFEVADPDTDLNIVRVLSKDRTRVYLMTRTNAIERPKGMDDLRVSFGEAPAGLAPPILAWYPSGQSRGHQFMYR